MSMRIWQHIGIGLAVAVVVALLAFAAITAWNGYQRHDASAEVGALVDQARHERDIERAVFEAQCYRDASQSD